MAHISLIFLESVPEKGIGSIAGLVSGLEAAGHRVESLRVGAGALPVAAPGLGELRVVGSSQPGLAAAAVAGLNAATGGLLVIVDPGLGYLPEDVASVVAPLLQGQADLSIGSRYARESGRLKSLAGWGAETLLGTSDPFSGLLAITREAFEEAKPGFAAVGSSYALELANRVVGRKVAVPIRSVRAWRIPRIGWNDIRHAKRLADRRYGTFSRLLQFCTVGASGMVIDLAMFALFMKLFEQTALATRVVPYLAPLTVSRAMARVLAIFIALCWNFSLNRRLTFADTRRDNSIVRQFVAYLLSNLLSIMVSLAISLGLPNRVEFFSRHVLTAAVIGIVVATAISFSMARWVVFRKARNIPIEPLVEPARSAPEPGPSNQSAAQPAGLLERA